MVSISGQIVGVQDWLNLDHDPGALRHVHGRWVKLAGTQPTGLHGYRIWETTLPQESCEPPPKRQQYQSEGTTLLQLWGHGVLFRAGWVKVGLCRGSPVTDSEAWPTLERPAPFLLITKAAVGPGAGPGIHCADEA